MTERFIKFLPYTEETQELLTNAPNAFLLLTQIASRAKRTNGSSVEQRSAIKVLTSREVMPGVYDVGW